MSSVNKVILVGRLGTDPELRFTQGGKAVCVMSVATNHTYTDKQNERQSKVNWHRVVAWGKQGESCKDHLTKGRQIYVEGRIENRSYEDKEGARRFTTEIVSNTVVFLDRARGDDWRRPGDPPAASERIVRPAPAAPQEQLDDLPF